MTADSPLKLDERTEQVIVELERALGGVPFSSFHDHLVRVAARDALRSRIRELVDEAEQNGIRVMARVANEKSP